MSHVSLWLTPEELVELTGYKTSRRQKLALGAMGVVFRSRAADGFPLVSRSLFETHTVLTPPRKRREPKWEALQ